jgi:hypothetical protein
MPTGMTDVELPRTDTNRPVEPLNIKLKSNGRILQMQDGKDIKKNYRTIIAAWGPCSARGARVSAWARVSAHLRPVQRVARGAAQDPPHRATPGSGKRPGQAGRQPRTS